MSGSCLYFSVGCLLFFHPEDKRGLPTHHVQEWGLGSSSQSQGATCWPHGVTAAGNSSGVPSRISPGRRSASHRGLRGPGGWAQQGWGGAGRSAEARPYLGESRVQVALQLVALMKGILELALRGRQGLLTLAEGLQQLLPLVQHVHHQLLKVGVGVCAMGGPQRVSLIDGGHHFTHGGGRKGVTGLAIPGALRSQGGQCQVSGQVGPGFSRGISCSCSERGQVPEAPLWDGA